MSFGTTDVKYPEPRQPLYEASTQFQNWRFSQEGLTHIREKLNEAAVTAIRNTFEVDEVKNTLLCRILSYIFHLSVLFYDDCAH